MTISFLFAAGAAMVCVLCETGGAFGGPRQLPRATSPKAARDAAPSGVTVNGEDAYAYLSRVSDGLYFRVPSAASGATALKIALKQGVTDDLVALYDGNGPSTYRIPVDPSVTALQIVLNPSPGSTNTLQIRDPAGKLVDATTNGVSLLRMGRNVLYAIQGPAVSTGNWTARVGGAGRHRLSAAAETSNRLDYSGDTSSGVGGTLKLTASVTDAVPDIAFGLVTTDGTTTVPVNLYDDGLHNDGYKNDSFYAGTQVMGAAGSYRLKVTGAGHFQRMYPILITAGDAEVIFPNSDGAPPESALPEILR